MHTLTGQRVQVGRQRGDQRLAFTGAHLGNLAVMQHHAADQLHIEMAHIEHATCGLTYGRKRLRQQVIERLAGGKP